jgi:uncharacterized membrane protein
MSFFNYIFYRICSFYEKKELDKTNPEIYASALISMMQLSILIFLLSIMDLFKLQSKEEAMLFFVPIIIIVMTVNALLIFTKKKYIELKDKYKGENSQRRYINGFFIVLWVILIFPLAITSIYFLLNE